MHGRGAWNTAGVGGTKKYHDASSPGPYYYFGSGNSTSTPDEYAVHRAVRAYQRALNRRIKANLVVDGRFGDQTAAAVWKFQEKHTDVTGMPWGGIGPQTSEALLKPDAVRVLSKSNSSVTIEMVTGTVRSESLWDAGAVGYYDPNDLGLAQINGPSHPNLTANERLNPLKAFQFIIDYYVNALDQLDGDVRDAVASYNLGIGGARSWIKDGRPDVWTPNGETRPRNVKDYVDKILQG